MLCPQRCRETALARVAPSCQVVGKVHQAQLAAEMRHSQSQALPRRLCMLAGEVWQVHAHCVADAWQRLSLSLDSEENLHLKEKLRASLERRELLAQQLQEMQAKLQQDAGEARMTIPPPPGLEHVIADARAEAQREGLTPRFLPVTDESPGALPRSMRPALTETHFGASMDEMAPTHLSSSGLGSLRASASRDLYIQPVELMRKREMRPGASVVDSPEWSVTVSLALPEPPVYAWMVDTADGRLQMRDMSIQARGAA